MKTDFEASEDKELEMNKQITIEQCRDLRSCIHEFTNGCVLTEDEYIAIKLILASALDRLKKKGRCLDEDRL